MELVDTLVRRDAITREDAEAQVRDAQERVLEGENPEDILFEEFGLEPDFVFDLLPV